MNHRRANRRVDYNDNYDSSDAYDDLRRKPKVIHMYRPKEGLKEQVISLLSTTSARVALSAYLAIPVAVPAIGRVAVRILTGAFLAGVLATLLLQHACNDIEDRLSKFSTQASAVRQAQ